MPKFVQNIEKILPNCWENDQRIGVLFAPFRPRNVNPESYDSKMKFWQNLIEAFCEHKGEALFNLTELQDNFQRKELKVKCLDTVLENLIQNNETRERAEFEEELFNSTSKWIFNCAIKRPLYWGLDIFKVTIGLSISHSWKQYQYVHLRVMHKFCEKLIAELLQEQMGKVFLYSEFKGLATTLIPGLSEEGLDLCLLQLKSQGLLGVEKLFAETEDETKVIKIAGKVKKETNLVEMDRLRVVWKIEDAKLQKLIQEIQIQSNELQRHLKENNREIAKDHLRKKKMLEKKFEKRSVVLNNIETLINSIEEAKSQGIILEAYKTGSKALKEALNSSGINCEKVEDIIADMKEAIEDQQEIEHKIATAAEDMNGNEIEEVQLEAELNEMIQTKEVEDDDVELLQMLNKLEVVSDKLETKEIKTKTIFNEN